MYNIKYMYKYVCYRGNDFFFQFEIIINILVSSFWVELNYLKLISVKIILTLEIRKRQVTMRQWDERLPIAYFTLDVILFHFVLHLDLLLLFLLYLIYSHTYQS